ncbi:hypothetical protein K7A41_01885 [Sphingobacterium sp. InxBP1]|uniref:hypothetical protein n=1 Tax=Sphingobacterium sp. InxBP1 TaxID=2870328 RepID=UPI002243F0D3|nr:hypothetical protein [Sphingobacterium sp. InxBP1]MCW8309965.1 hypothetical protein [Sphingobacterium sp. InxBP1]
MNKSVFKALLYSLFGTQTNYSHLKIPFDNLEIYILSDGYFDIGSYQPIIATDAAPADLQNELNRLHLPADIYEAPINVMLIRKNEQLILVDTGEGFYDKKMQENYFIAWKVPGSEPVIFPMY